MNVELKHLRSFVAVAEELNFTRAAERLHLTQQALSGQIRQLEERIGTKLLERDTRRVDLTPAGSALLESARPLIAGAELAVVAAQQAGQRTQTLTVGFVAAITHTQMGQALDAFAQAHPGVELLIHFGELTDPSGGIRSGHADVAAVHGPFDSRDLELAYLWLGPDSGIVWRPVPGLEPLEHSLAWRRGDERELVREFASACLASFA